MLKMRNASISDHEFLVRIDLKNDGYTVSDEVDMSEQEKEEHSKKIGRFLTDADKGVFIIEDSVSNKPVAMIKYSIANRNSVYPWKTVFNKKIGYQEVRRGPIWDDVIRVSLIKKLS